MPELDEAIPPHAADDPPWCVSGDVAGAGDGRLYAWRGAAGAVVLSFDAAGRQHALTLLHGRPVAAQITLHGRRFTVAIGNASVPGEEFP